MKFRIKGFGKRLNFFQILNKIKINKYGFTLVELLVVVAIIGLLASVVLVALSEARIKARDAKRLGDMNQLAKALEFYINVNYSYPTYAGGSLGNMTGSPPMTPSFLSSLPANVLPNDGPCALTGAGSNEYYFLPNNNGNKVSTYAITFCLGKGSGSLGPGPHTLTQGGFQ